MENMHEMDARERTEILSQLLGLMVLLLQSDANGVLFIERAKRRAMEFVSSTIKKSA